MTASPDLCLGSIQIGHHDLMQALAAGRTRRVRINAHRNSAQVNMQNIVTMLMRGALSTGECFLEWKELVHREKNLKYFGLERTLAFAKARYVRQGRLLPEI